jgi:hypothetical protein
MFTVNAELTPAVNVDALIVPDVESTVSPGAVAVTPAPATTLTEE